jgi:hypothetical protein
MIPVALDWEDVNEKYAQRSFDEERDDPPARGVSEETNGTECGSERHEADAKAGASTETLRELYSAKAEMLRTRRSPIDSIGVHCRVRSSHWQLRSRMF